MKIIGLTKIRNEETIIQDTLDHWGRICSGGIYIVDDVSTDRSVEICKNHPAVKGVLINAVWDLNRERAEWVNRQHALSMAKKSAEPCDWFVYFDADERLYLEENVLNYLFSEEIDAIACRLYDVYITPDDVEKNYLEREWVGPEYRTIVFFFKNSSYLKYDQPDQRIVSLAHNAKVVTAGVIKHFGKGISIEQWEDTCDYYIKYWRRYSVKWAERKGKAVKKDYQSDFCNDLIKFNDVLSGKTEGIPLEKQTYGRI